MNKNMRKLMAALLIVSASQGLAADSVAKNLYVGVVAIVAGVYAYEAKKNHDWLKKGSHWQTVKIVPSRSAFHNDTAIIEYRDVETSEYDRNFCGAVAAVLASLAVLVWCSE